jgi:hypothetical protein
MTVADVAEAVQRYADWNSEDTVTIQTLSVDGQIIYDDIDSLGRLEELGDSPRRERCVKRLQQLYDERVIKPKLLSLLETDVTPPIPDSQDIDSDSLGKAASYNEHCPHLRVFLDTYRKTRRYPQVICIDVFATDVNGHEVILPQLRIHWNT